MPDVSYVPGPLTAVAGDQCWVLVEASPDSPAVARIWQQLSQGTAADGLLAGLLADGLGGTPGFALLTAGTDGQHRLFCRGAVGATVVAKAGAGETSAERLAGTGLLTWREHVVASAARVFLGAAPADAALRLPAASGVLLAGCVIIDFTNSAARETAEYSPAKPAERPKKPIVFFPDTETLPPADGDASQATPAPAPVASPVAFAPSAFPAPPPPVAEPARSAPNPASGLNGAPVAVNGGPGGDDEYDFLWGGTQMRSVEDAAIRSPEDGGPLPPGQFAFPGGPPLAMPPPPAPPSRLWQGPGDPVQPGGMPPSRALPGPPMPSPPMPGRPLAGPPGGLIDVPQWMAGPGESSATVKRGDAPEPVVRTAPPDRIGPVVPALICQHGHVNPPSGAACRRCGAPLPHDPVSVPRPVLGVLRLSLGDVITLDRGVVMGRNPRTDFAGPDGEERPHVVKLPAADGDVSRTHLRVTLDGWHVLVTDLKSTNGTLVSLPGRDPQQLRPGEPVPIQPGTLVTLAEGVDFRYEVAD